MMASALRPYASRLFFPFGKNGVNDHSRTQHCRFLYSYELKPSQASEQMGNWLVLVALFLCHLGVAYGFHHLGSLSSFPVWVYSYDN